MSMKKNEWPCECLRCTGKDSWKPLLERLEGRGEADHSRDETVRGILDAVRRSGDAAVLGYCRQHDCPDMSLPLRVPQDELDRAYELTPRVDMAVIEEAAENIRAFHEAQKERSWFMTREDGAVLGQRMLPVDRAGLYVPGGRGGETPLLSSLLMTAVPALTAGVSEVAVVSPPRRDGTLNPCLLAAARYLGINEVYRMGGAWAVAALAYGTETVAPVDVIAGPGNAWVTAAKRMVQGRVGIDMIAGPSEVLILADSSANPDWIAADMLAQAEHDPFASALCLVWDARLAERVLDQLAVRLESLPRVDIARSSLKDWGAVVVLPDMKQAVELANEVAPEHLEALVADPWSILPKIRHAGALFLGPWSPEPMGDYMAGPNHVLPTMRTARFSSALSVQTFTRRMSVIAAGPDFAARCVSPVARLARLEQLEAHARSMECRARRA